MYKKSIQNHHSVYTFLFKFYVLFRNFKSSKAGKYHVQGYNALFWGLSHENWQQLPPFPLANKSSKTTMFSISLVTANIAIDSCLSKKSYLWSDLARLDVIRHKLLQGRVYYYKLIDIKLIMTNTNRQDNDLEARMQNGQNTYGLKAIMFTAITVSRQKRRMQTI